MKPVKFILEGALEFEAASVWYENQQTGLGSKFVNEVDIAIELLKSPNPPLTPVLSSAGQKSAKKLQLQKFPYSMIVYETDDFFHIIALAHNSRKPGYWRERLVQ
jgi:hypothetical protein